MPGEVIGGDRPRVRVVLIEPDAVREVGAEFAQQPAHSPQDEVALPTAAVMAIKWKSWRPDDLVGNADLPIIGPLGKRWRR
jgi:hypothetical protein